MEDDGGDRGEEVEERREGLVECLGGDVDRAFDEGLGRRGGVWGSVRGDS